MIGRNRIDYYLDQLIYISELLSEHDGVEEILLEVSILIEELISQRMTDIQRIEDAQLELMIIGCFDEEASEVLFEVAQLLNELAENQVKEAI